MNAAKLALAALAAVVTLLALAQPAAAFQDCPAEVRAPSAIVVEERTRTVICERRAGQDRPVGSAVKLMTALLVLERAKLSDVYTTGSYRADAVESQIGLVPGEEMKVRDLMRGLLIESGNDAAATLAEGVAGSRPAFVKLMNRRARELELADTRYRNPIGLDARGAHSSVRDLVALSLRLRRNSFFRRLVNQPSITLTSGVRPRTFANRNDLVRTVDWVNGIKTGHTLGAGYVLVGAGRLSGLQLISAVAGARSEAQRDSDTRSLLTWARRQVRRVTAARAGRSLEPLVTVPIRYRPGAELELLVGRTQRRLVPAGEGNPFTVRPLEVPDEVEGPIAPGERLGSAAIMQGDRRVDTIPLVAAAGVPEAGLGQKTKAAFTRPLPIVLAFAVLGGTVLLARRRRRGSRPGRRRASEEPQRA